MLLERLNEVRDLRWIRLMYLFPDRSARPVLEAIASLPKMCRYVDIPFQHASGEVLRRMNRPGNGQEYLDLLEKLRAASGGWEMAVRSTFIVGFPGETEAHFAELEAFVRAAELDWMGVFRYSPEEGSTAASMPGQVPRRVGRERYERLMAVQQEVTAARLRRWTGREVEVVVEAIDGAAARGRTQGQAPEIDGETLLDVGALPDTWTGDFVRAVVMETGLYDLKARAVELLHRPPRRDPNLLHIGVTTG